MVLKSHGLFVGLLVWEGTGHRRRHANGMLQTALTEADFSALERDGVDMLVRSDGLVEQDLP